MYVLHLSIFFRCHLLFLFLGYRCWVLASSQHPCWLFIEGGDWSKPLKVYSHPFTASLFILGGGIIF